MAIKSLMIINSWSPEQNLFTRSRIPTFPETVFDLVCELKRAMPTRKISFELLVNNGFVEIEIWNETTLERVYPIALHGKGIIDSRSTVLINLMIGNLRKSS